LACNDSLTGLLNHRTLREALARELERSRRSDAPLSVLMLDLDNFKQINDQRGHQAGDDVLRAVAEIIRDGIREADHAGRYGGEEFLVIFVDSPLTQARSAAERIRERIDALAAEGPQASAITVSGGLCQATPELQVDDLVRLADIRLYQAKRAGKNRIVS